MDKKKENVEVETKVEAKKTETKVEAKKTETKVEASEVRKFSKKQFLSSNKFSKRKDLVNALLKEGKQYSIKEVEDLINNFLYGKK